MAGLSIGTWILLGALAAELAAAILIAVKGRRNLASRFLAGYLFAAPVALLLFLFAARPAEFGSSVAPSVRALLFVLSALLVGLLGSLLLGFALTHPTPILWLQRTPGRVAYVFLPLLVLPIASAGVQFFHYEEERVDIPAGGLDPESFFANPAPSGQSRSFYVNGAPAVALLYFVGGAVAAAVISLRRSRRAGTPLERSRLRFVAIAVGIPLAVAGAAALALGAVVVADLLVRFAGGDDTPDLERGAAGAALNLLQWSVIPFVVLAPALAAGYVLLRYRLLNLDLRLRFALRASLVGTAFVLAFFVVAESLEAWVTHRMASQLWGVAAAAALLPVYKPLERVADRMAGRAFPATDDLARYRTARAREIYAAALEDNVRGPSITPAQRLELDVLAHSLGLTPEVAAGLERGKPGPAPAGPRRAPTRAGT